MGSTTNYLGDFSVTLTNINALSALRPGQSWGWKGDGSDYSQLSWLDSESKPTESDITNHKATLEAAAPMVELRRQRDERLRECDWWASSDLTISDEQKTYRVALRDMPETSPSPTLSDLGVLGNITWPTKP
jgi:hypothetical protein